MNVLLLLIVPLIVGLLVVNNLKGTKVKSAKRARAKLERSLATAGEEIEAGMLDAEDPVKKLLSDPKKYQAKMVTGLQRAIADDKVTQGLERADKRQSWPKSIPRAKAHYVEAGPRMTDNYMDGYPTRASVMESIKAEISDMPTDTTAQRIQKSAVFQTKMHEAKKAGKFQ